MPHILQHQRAPSRTWGSCGGPGPEAGPRKQGRRALRPRVRSATRRGPRPLSSTSPETAMAPLQHAVEGAADRRHAHGAVRGLLLGPRRPQPAPRRPARSARPASRRLSSRPPPARCGWPWPATRARPACRPRRGASSPMIAIADYGIGNHRRRDEGLPLRGRGAPHRRPGRGCARPTWGRCLRRNKMDEVERRSLRAGAARDGGAAAAPRHLHRHAAVRGERGARLHPWPRSSFPGAVRRFEGEYRAAHGLNELRAHGRTRCSTASPRARSALGSAAPLRRAGRGRDRHLRLRPRLRGRSRRAASWACVHPGEEPGGRAAHGRGLREDGGRAIAIDIRKGRRGPLRQGRAEHERRRRPLPHGDGSGTPSACTSWTSTRRSTA